MSWNETAVYTVLRRNSCYKAFAYLSV